MGARVYSYIRFSDARQAAGASSERQRAYAEQWAKEHGLTLDDELSLRDEGTKDVGEAGQARVFGSVDA